MDPLDNKAFQELLKKWPAAALRYLQKHYYHKLLQTAVQRTHNREASEDIVQETLLEVWKKAKSLATEERIQVIPYLYGIVRHKATNWFNQFHKRENLQSSDKLDQLVSTSPDAEHEMILADHHRNIRDMVSLLSDREKVCVELKYFHDMSNDSIARELGLSKKSVEKYLTNALKRLRGQHVFRKQYLTDAPLPIGYRK